MRLILANADAVELTDTGVKVSYTAPPSGTDNTLRDVAGNDAESFADRDVTVEADTAAPSLASVTVDGATLTLNYGEGLDEDSEPASSAFEVKVGGSVVSLAGTNPVAVEGPAVTLTLAAAVAPDAPVTVSYTVPSTNPIQDLAGNDAGSLSERSVTNETVDETAPTLASATVDGATLTLTYDEGLDEGSEPASSAFEVKVGGSVVSLAGTNPVAVEGPAVTLTLAAAAAHDATVTVSYTVPSESPIQDLVGNDAGSLSERSVTNETADEVAPSLASATMSVATLTLTYDERLDEGSEPASSAFEVKVGGSVVSLAGTNPVAVEGPAVTLTLAAAVAQDATVTVSYTAPPTNPIQDLVGNDAASFADVAVREGRLVLAVELVSTPTVDADGDDTNETYKVGDVVRARVTFGGPVDVVGSPVLKLRLDPGSGEKSMTFDTSRSRTDTTTLEFTWTVEAGDLSTQGIAFYANELRVGANASIRVAGRQVDASLAFAKVGHDAGHKVDGVAPMVIETDPISVISAAGADGTYAIGDAIDVRVTFTEAVTVTTAGDPVAGPGIQISIDGESDPLNAKLYNAVYRSGSGTNALVFRYTVAAGDADPDGISFIANAMSRNGGKIADAAGNEATFTQLQSVAVDSLGRHKVDGVRPAVSSASVAGTTLTVTFDEPLGAAASLANGAFEVKKRPQGGTERTVGLAGSPAISGSTVTLILANADAVELTDTGVKVSYTAPPSGTDNTLRDVAGNDAESFADRDVTVEADTAAPSLASVTVDGATLTLNYGEGLDEDSEPASSAFEVKVGGSVVSLAGTDPVAVEGPAVTLTLAAAVAHDATVTVSYTAPSESPIQDLVGNDAGSLSERSVTNETADEVAPTLASATVDGATLTLTFDEGLDEGSEPASSAFEVKVGGSVVSLAGTNPVAVEGPAVTLTLAAAVAQDATVTVSYTVPSESPIRDLAGNDAGSLSERSVTNETVDETAPTLASATVDGATLTLTFDEALGEAASLANGAFAVKKTPALGSETEVSLGATAPAISGATVTLTLASAVVVSDTAVKVSYTRPTQGSANRLADAFGNEVSSFADQAVTNATAPVVTAVEMVSSAGADATYVAGDAVDVQVSFDASVSVDETNGTPRVKLDLDAEDEAAGERWAGYVSGSGTTALVFRYTVVAGDTSARGIAVVADTLEANGGTLRSGTGTGAALGHVAVAASTSHKVDAAAPALSSATVSGTSLVLTFDEALGEAASLANGAFAVKKTPALGSEAEVSLGATAPAISGATVTLTLASAVVVSDTAVKVSYTKPSQGSANRLADAFGNEVSSFADRDVAVEGRTKVSTVALVSTPTVDADGDDTNETYKVGDVVRARVTFNGAVDVVGSPVLKLRLDSESGEKSMTFDTSRSRTDTTTLEFTWTVEAGDLSTQGIAFYANELSMGANAGIRAAGTQVDALLAFAKVDHDASHKVDGVAPMVIETDPISVISAAGTDGAYAIGDAIDVRVTFTEAVTVTTAGDPVAGPRVLVSVGGEFDLVNAVYHSGSGTNALVFRYTVAAGDADPDGISFIANAMSRNGGKIADAAGNEATFTQLQSVAVDSLGRHKVDGVRPAVSSASVAGTTLTVTFDEPLGAAASLANGAFEVKKRPQGGTERTVGLAGSPTISGSTVRLILANADAVELTDTGVKVSYTAPPSGTDNTLRDVAGNDAESFADRDVTVEADTAAPSLASVTVDGATLTLNYGEGLDEDSEPASSAFEVKVGGSVVSLAGTDPVAVEGPAVTLTLAAAVAHDATVTVSYTAPSESPIQDLVGNDAGSLSERSVTNETADEVAPTLASATVDGATLTLTFDEGLDEGSEPASSAFEVKVGGSVVSLAGTNPVAVEGPAVTLTLAAAVAQDATVTVSYTVPSESPIRDLAGNDAGSLSERSVTNETVDETAPTLASATVDGATLTLTFDEALGQAASLANGAFAVKKTPALGSETEVSLGATAPAISGATVTLTLASAVVVSDTAVKVSYTRPTQGSANRLADAFGNEVSSFADRAVTNATAPVVTAVEMVSSAGADATYVAGDAVDVQVSFDASVSVDETNGTPRVKLDLDAEDEAAGERWAGYVSGSGTTALVFRYTVVAGDTSARGIAVVADTLEANGGTLRSGTGTGAALGHVAVAASTSHKVDAAAPALSSATVSGTSLVLTFDEALGEAASLANGAFAVKKTPALGSESEVSLGATAPAISGATVTLTLASAVVVSDTAVKVSYTKPSQGSANRLADAFGNEVSSFADRDVAVEGRTKVSTVALVSTPTVDADGDDTNETYKVGDVVRARVTFNGAVDVVGSPVLKLRLDPGSGEKSMTFDTSRSRTDTTTLEFTWTVEAGDLSTQGIAFYANELRVGANASIRVAGTQVDASLAFAKVDHDAGHKVDGVAPALIETDPLSVISAAGANGTYAIGDAIDVRATFTEAVTVTTVGDPVAGPRILVSVGGEYDLVSAVYRSGSGTNALVFRYTVAAGDADTDGISFIANAMSLGGGKIADAAGNEATFTQLQSVAVDSLGRHKVDGVRPAVSSASVAGTTLTVTFDEPLGAAASLANGAFEVKKRPQGGTERTVGLAGSPTISGSTVRLILANADAVELTDTGVKVSYTAPPSGTGNTLRDVAGNDAESFADRDVTVEADTAAPTLASATVDEATLTLNYGEGLDKDSEPASSAFEVKVGGSVVSLAGTDPVAVEGPAVTLTLAAAVAHDATVTVSYTAPSTNPIQDLAGNDAGSFSERSVRNEAVDGTAPTLASATVDGTALTLTYDERLDEGSEPASSAFEVKVGGSVVSLAGTHPVAVEGAEVTLTLAAAVAHDATVTVSYTAPSTNPVQDLAGNDAGSLPERTVTNETADEVAPTLASAAVDGATLTLTFDERLDGDSEPATSAFTVTVAGGTQSVSGVDVSGAAVTLTLGTAVNAGQAVQVRYARPGEDALADASGSEVASFADQAVTNVTAPVVTAVELVSSAGADATYVVGDEVKVQVSFDASVNVDGANGTPRLKIDLDPAEWGEKWAAYKSGSGTAELTFAYQVEVPNTSRQGLAVLANTLERNGGTIKSAAGTEAVLAHVGLVHDARHKVDTAAPALASAAVDGATLILTYDEGLDEDSEPASSAFEVKVGESVASLAGTNPVAVEGTAVTLTLAAAVPQDATVTVSYTVPSTNPIQDLAGNDAGSLSERSVTNETVDETAPTLASATVAGATLILTYDEGLDEDSEPASSAFEVKVGGSVASLAGINPVAVEGTAVTLTLAAAVAHDATVTVSYTAPSTNPIQDLSGNDAGSLSERSVTNETVDETAPTLASATVDGATLTLTFDETLGEAASLANGAFAVKKTPALGSESEVSLGAAAPVISGATVTLTLASEVVSSDTAVKVSYTRPTQGSANRLADAFGNEVASFAGRAVTNVTAPVVTAVELVSSAGADATYVAGDAVDVRVTFAVAVTVDETDGTPRVKLDLDSDDEAAGERWAEYESGLRHDGAGVPLHGGVGRHVHGRRCGVGGHPGGERRVRLRSGTGADAALGHVAVSASASHKVDAASPSLASAAVSGTALVLTFDETLGEAASLANGAFAVKKTPALGSESEVSLGAAAPVISGATVTLTLASEVVSSDTAVKVSYTRPTQGSANRLADAFGNEVASFAGQAVTNVTAPVVTAVELVSSAGADATYVAGDAVDVRVTFAVAVTVDETDGTPRVKLDLDSEDEAAGERWAGYVSGSGTTALVFRYTVVVGRHVGARRCGVGGHPGGERRYGSLGHGRGRGAGARGGVGEREPQGGRGVAVACERGGVRDGPRPHVRRDAGRGRVACERRVCGEEDAGARQRVRGEPGRGGAGHLRRDGDADPCERGGVERHRGEGELHAADAGQRQPACRRVRQRGGELRRPGGDERDRAGGDGGGARVVGGCGRDLRGGRRGRCAGDVCRRGDGGRDGRHAAGEARSGLRGRGRGRALGGVRLGLRHDGAGVPLHGGVGRHLHGRRCGVGGHPGGERRYGCARARARTRRWGTWRCRRARATRWTRRRRRLRARRCPGRPSSSRSTRRWARPRRLRTARLR